jgi:hypothetical protein
VTDLETFGEIRQIRARLEGIEHTQQVLVRSQEQVILPPIMAVLKGNDMLARVFLLVDGQRTQGDIGKALAAQGVSGDKSLVSRHLEKLAMDLQVIELADQRGTAKIYKKAGIDSILKITRQLERWRASEAKREAAKPPAG